eukprot:TRINITY_DN22_c0_g2_i2.p1 TRINITY_DN22_c0_g2~~TRINITY_DN22_c0_g2_i2.p1  ORF type:complete len:251 (+),score=-35.79 TRINITY_DN22_c0_g2_i2:60-755(+)
MNKRAYSEIYFKSIQRHKLNLQEKQQQWQVGSRTLHSQTTQTLFVPLLGHFQAFYLLFPLVRFPLLPNKIQETIKMLPTGQLQAVDLGDLPKGRMGFKLPQQPKKHSLVRFQAKWWERKTWLRKEQEYDSRNYDKQKRFLPNAYLSMNGQNSRKQKPQEILKPFQNILQGLLIYLHTVLVLIVCAVLTLLFYFLSFLFQYFILKSNKQKIFWPLWELESHSAFRQIPMSTT